MEPLTLATVLLVIAVVLFVVAAIGGSSLIGHMSMATFWGGVTTVILHSIEVMMVGLGGPLMWFGVGVALLFGSFAAWSTVGHCLRVLGATDATQINASGGC